MSRLFSYCIHTFRHSGTLQGEEAAGGSHKLAEGKVWKTGSELWAEAERSGARMPVIFSAADVSSGLIFWATIDDITVDYDNRRTECWYSGLRKIDPPRPRSALRLRAGNRRLSDKLIRPYAICQTPDFLIGR